MYATLRQGRNMESMAANTDIGYGHGEHLIAGYRGNLAKVQ